MEDSAAGRTTGRADPRWSSCAATSSPRCWRRSRTS